MPVTVGVGVLVTAGVGGVPVTVGVGVPWASAWRPMPTRTAAMKRLRNIRGGFTERAPFSTGGSRKCYHGNTALERLPE